MDLNKCKTIQNRIKATYRSCKTIEQLAVARKYNEFGIKMILQIMTQDYINSKSAITLHQKQLNTQLVQSIASVFDQMYHTIRDIILIKDTISDLKTIQTTMSVQIPD